LIGADELIYNDIDDLKKIVGLDDICTACMTGEYPTDVSEAKVLEDMRKRHLEKSTV